MSFRRLVEIDKFGKVLLILRCGVVGIYNRVWLVVEKICINCIEGF